MRGIPLIVTTALLLAGLAATVGPASAGQSGDQPFLIRDGVSQPIYSYQNAIRETAWVNIGQDLDGDGVTDRVAVDIIRPAEPAAHGQRIPVIMEESPYNQCCGRGNENQKKTYAPDGTPTGFPLFYDNYFVPRGYAVALVDNPGTSRSTGCNVSSNQISSGVDVINWLNGKGEGFTTPRGSVREYANWSDGTVGMIGKSNDGLTAMGVAATGVPGLRTVVPIAGVSDLYQFWNPGGAFIGPPSGPAEDDPGQQVACQAADAADLRTLYQPSGDLTPAWAAQDFNLTASRIRASVFSVQGFGDENVDPIQFGEWWQALAANNVPRKAWLHQAGHTDPFDLRRADWVNTLHRWFDRWLLDVPNGIDHEPMISIEHTPDQWVDEPNWPPAGTRPHVLRPGTGSTPGIGTLGPALGDGTETLTDTTDPNVTRFTWTDNLTTPATDRVVFTSVPVTHDTRLAGTSTLTVDVRSGKPVATVSAELLDLGPATVRNDGGPTDATGIVNLTTRSCWGESSATDSACYLDTKADLVDVDQQIISVGWTDVGHFAGPFQQLPLDPNRFYSRQLTLSTMDHIIPAGHRLALIVGGTDYFEFSPLSQAPTLTFDLAATTLSVPIAPRD